MKKMVWFIIGVIIYISSIAFFSSGCSLFREERYGDMAIGQFFYGNRDGDHMRLPKDYCLQIDYSGGTSLFKVSETDKTKPFMEVYNTPKIISGHYILGYYTETHMIFCEEKEKGVFNYFSFSFDTQEIKDYPDKQAVMDEFEFSAKDWITLCNTLEELDYN